MIITANETTYRHGTTPQPAFTQTGGSGLIVWRTASGADVLRALAHSSYEAALHREPDADEEQSFLAALVFARAQGLNPFQSTTTTLIRALFLATSDETNPARTDRDYVADLYGAYLQRVPDASGLTFWTNTIANTSRASVRAGFETAQEFLDYVEMVYEQSAPALVNPTQGDTTTLTASNQTATIIVAARDANGVKAAQVVQVYATFPLVADKGFELEDAPQALVSISDDKKNKTVRYKGGKVRSWTLQFKGRKRSDYDTAKAFLDGHEIDLPFYLDERILGTLAFVKADSSLKTTPNLTNLIDFDFIVKEASGGIAPVGLDTVQTTEDFVFDSQGNLITLEV